MHTKTKEDENTEKIFFFRVQEVQYIWEYFMSRIPAGKKTGGFQNRSFNLRKGSDEKVSDL